MPNTHLVMHGSSSVPQELQDIINEFGGEMPQTFGVPVEEIVAASSTACARSTSTPTAAWR
jgi:fructose/tagatose bisphosphate aldolase